MISLPLLLLLAQAEKPILSDVELQDLARRAIPLVEKTSGAKFKKAPVLRISTREEMEKALAAELVPQIKILAPESDPADAKDHAARMARTYGDVLIGKYAWSDGTVHIVPATLDRLAAQLKRPEIRDVRLLRVIVTHELVHAIDQQEHAALSRLGDITSRNELEVLNALIEGHAQHVTRKIFDAAGELADFDAYEKLILAGPATMSEGEKYLASLVTASFRLAYIDGRTFFDALEKTGRPGYVADAFRTPPAEKNTILHPERFYAPRPKAERFDPGPAFDTLKTVYGDAWTRTTPDFDESMLRLAFGDFIPAKDVDAALKEVVQAHALILNPKIAPQSKMVIVSLLRTSSPEGAMKLHDASVALSKAKDVRLKAGNLRITKADYAILKAEETTLGTLIRKTVAYEGQSISVTSLIGTAGIFEFELILNNEELDDAALKTLVGRFREALKAK